MRGVSLNPIPIFNRFAMLRSTSVRKAKLTYENAAGYHAQLAKNTLSKTIFQAVQDLERGSKTIRFRHSKRTRRIRTLLK